MTGAEILSTLALVTCPPGMSLLFSQEELWLLVAIETGDADTGLSGTQRSRKWRLSEHMTRSEVVQTALKAVLTAVEHEAREKFLYRGRAIFGPHFDVDELARLCDDGIPDIRGAARLMRG